MEVPFYPMHNDVFFKSDIIIIEKNIVKNPIENNLLKVLQNNAKVKVKAYPNRSD
jgi:hypothetical protein